MSTPETELLLIAEGEIASVHILEGLIGACRPHGVRFQRKLVWNVQDTDFGPETVPMLVRCADPAVLPLVNAFRQTGRPYLYYLDDHFWKLAPDTPVGQYYQLPLVRESLETAVRGAAAVLIHSEYLEPFVRTLNPNVHVLPAVFDFSTVAGVQPEPRGEIRIGFAGSTSRVHDLEPVIPMIRELLAFHPRVVFEFAGTLPQGVLPGGRVRFFPPMADYRGFMRFQRSRGWAIGLAPLLDSEANRAKTNTKYREYGACEIAGLYAAIPPYAGTVQPDTTGILVPDTDPQAWIDAAKRLVADEGLRVRMGKAAREDVYRKHRLDYAAEVWSPHLRGASDGRQYPAVRFPLLSWQRLPRSLRPAGSLLLQASAMYKFGGAGAVSTAVARRFGFLRP